jgi:hypothetical protein
MIHLSVILEDDEATLLRASLRMMQMLNMDELQTELISNYVNKMLEATASLSQEWKKEIGKMQRAMRRLPEEYKGEFLAAINMFNQRLIGEMMKERDLP